VGHDIEQKLFVRTDKARAACGLLNAHFVCQLIILMRNANLSLSNLVTVQEPDGYNTKNCALEFYEG
jgi:hypothetical protein